MNNEAIQNTLGIQDQDNTRKAMAIMRTRRIMLCLKDLLMVERKQTIFPMSNIVEETKSGSRKYRDILDRNDAVRVKPWITMNDKFSITDKPGNEKYFFNMLHPGLGQATTSFYDESSRLAMKEPTASSCVLNTKR